MTLKKRCPIRTTLSKILSAKRIRDLAERMGAVTRQRKVDIVSLIAVLVLCGRVDHDARWSRCGAVMNV